MKFQKASIALLITASASAVCNANEQTSNNDMPSFESLPTHMQMFINLGSAGLLTELASFENMSVTQGRLGNSRSQVEFARASTITTGYKDSTDVFVLPLDAFYALPSKQGKALIRAGAIFGDYDSDKGDLTEVDTQLARAELQYFVSPDINTLLGAGAYYESSEADLQHLNGSLDRAGFGIRADALRKFSPHWGVAARLDYNIATNETSVPVGPGTTLSYDLDDTRLYVQTDFVGTYGKNTMGFLPEQWIFRPAFGALYQRTNYDTTTTSLGSTVTGTAGKSEEYSMASLSVRLESIAFGRGVIAPHIEVGLEHELKNDVNDYVDDANIVHLDIGASMNVSRAARLDVIYSQHDGTDDLRSDKAITLHLGMAL